MASSLLKLAEQCRVILAKGDIQSLIASVIDAYGSIAKKEWYENKADSVNEVDGVFLAAFKDIAPELDLSNDMYYIINPSSYLRLPLELGVQYVGFTKGRGFVKITMGSSDIWSSIKAGCLGGSQTYYIEGNRTYFPKMTNLTNSNIKVVYAVALDNMDVEADLNIPPNIADQIVNMVVTKYMNKPVVVPEKLN